MNRTILYVLGGLVLAVLLAVGGVLAAASMRPDVLVVERSATLPAPPSDVQPLLTDFQTFTQWSPWHDRDPDQTVTFSDPPRGEGAWYTWDGDDNVGAGRMEITSVTPMRVEQDLTFTRPFEASADVIYILAETDGGTSVTWRMEQPENLMSKTMGLFMDMDAMIGTDFETGLARLAPLAEQARDTRVAAEQAEAERLAAEQAATEEAGEAEGEAAGGMAADE